MPLNLDEFLPKDDEVTLNGEKFVFNTNFPASIIYKLNSITKDEFGEKEFEAIKDVLKNIFYIKNDKNKVDKFIDNLSLVPLTKLIMYVSEYIKIEIEDKKKIDLKSA